MMPAPATTIALPPLLMTWLQLYCSAHGEEIARVAADAIALHLDDIAGDLIGEIGGVEVTEAGRFELWARLAEGK